MLKNSDRIKKCITIFLAIFSAIFINMSLSKKIGIYESLNGNSIFYIILSFCFYQIISKANNCDLNEILFVDDIEENIINFNKVGIYALLPGDVDSIIG